MGLAVERYIAVLHPLKTRILQSGKRIALVLGIIWTFALVVSAPVPAYFDLVSVLLWNLQPPPNFTTGDWEQENSYSESDVSWSDALELYTCVVPKSSYGTWVAFRWINLILLFVVPLGVMSFCYFKIGRRLLKRKDPVNPGVPYASKGVDFTIRMRKKTAHRVILVLTCAVISFFVCWAPTMIYEVLIVTMDIQLDQSTLTARYVFDWMAVSTCAHNPILYTLLHEKFRKTLVSKLFHKRRATKTNSNRVTPTRSGVNNSTKESSDADVITSSGDGPALLISVYKDKKRGKAKGKHKSDRLMNVEDLSEEVYAARPRSLTFA